MLSYGFGGVILWFWSSVMDPECFDSDLTFQADADPDPTFQADADPNPKFV